MIKLIPTKQQIKEAEKLFDFGKLNNSVTKVDVKTKRFSNMQTPTAKWNASVLAFNINQKCDWYCFVGVSNDYKVSYIYGFKEKDDFYKEATFGKKDEIDPNGSGNNWTFREDTYYLSIKNLIL